MRAKHGTDWRLFVLVWLLLAGMLAIRALATGGGGPLLADTDDAMRMVVVRDLLAGQGWYDPIQHRLDTPFGGEMHWSRLADLPLAALMLVLRPLLGASADMTAAFVLPLLLLGPLLWLSGRIGVALAGGGAWLPALVLPALSLSVLAEFNPGRVDHHALQILLLLAMAWCALEALDRPRFAVGAGLAAAAAIAIGIEGLPSVAAAIAAFGLAWMLSASRATALRLFGLSFAAGTLLLLAGTVDPARWLVAACDAISPVYAGLAVGVGSAFVVLSHIATRGAGQRMALLVAAAAAVAIGLAIAFPECLGGPYAALDPWLRANWIDRVTEAEPLWVRLFDDPVYPLALAIPCALALGAVLWSLLRGPREDRARWLVYGLFLLLAILTMLVQIRASRMATLLAVPAAAALIVALRQLYLARPTLPRIGALVLAWVGSAGLAVAALTVAATSLLPATPGRLAEGQRLSVRQCLAPAAFEALASLPPGDRRLRFMTPIDLGSHLLLETPHDVVAAPYHRNQRAVRDTFDFFNTPIAAARDILARRGIDYVAVCPAMPEMRGLAAAAPESFVRLFAGDALPDWLVPVAVADSPLRVYAVAPPAAR